MEYPSNSHKLRDIPAEKPEDKKIERVTSNDAVRRKPSLGKRFSSVFVGGDSKSVISYVTFDVLVPAAKEMISDAVGQGIERMLFGETRGRRNKPAASGNGYVSYNRYSSGPLGAKPNQEAPRPISNRSRATHDFDEIILTTRVEAEEVIERLFDLVSRYEIATVSDLYDLVGISGNYTDDKWGWTDLRGSGVSQVRGGYLLDLPKPKPID